MSDATKEPAYDASAHSKSSSGVNPRRAFEAVDATEDDERRAWLIETTGSKSALPETKTGEDSRRIHQVFIRNSSLTGFMEEPTFGRGAWTSGPNGKEKRLLYRRMSMLGRVGSPRLRYSGRMATWYR